MLNEINLPHGKIVELVKVFKKGRPYIRKCLRGQRSDELALKIRYTALTQLGGYEVQKVKNN